MNKTVESISDKVIQFINETPFLKNIIKEVFVIGKIDNTRLNDLDFVLFVESNDHVLIIDKFSELLVSLIKLEGILISLFPVNIMRLEKADSMFIQNIINYGTKVK